MCLRVEEQVCWLDNMVDFISIGLSFSSHKIGLIALTSQDLGEDLMIIMPQIKYVMVGTLNIGQ